MKYWTIPTILLMTILFCYGCIAPIEHQQETMGGDGVKGDALSGENDTNVTDVSNVSSEEEVLENNTEDNFNETEGILNETTAEEPLEEEEPEEISYGTAVAGSNDTYMFKMNYQLSFSEAIIRMENILMNSIFVLVNKTEEKREKISLLENVRISGINITLTEIFYDNLAEGRMAYLRITN
jgi:hypothetical protein